MNPSGDDEDGDFFSNIGKSKKLMKEDALDETFKKAEKLKRTKPKEGKKISEKPFRKLGIVLIVIAIISLFIINYLPWMYVRFNSDSGPIEEFYYRDFINLEGEYYNEVDYIFKSPCTNCSNNSKNFIGVDLNDFSNVPVAASYGFLLLAFLGLIFTIFAIIEKKQNFSIEIVSFIHIIFAIACILISIAVLILCTKFLGLYFLLYYNMPFIEASGVDNVILVFLGPIFLIIISIVIIRVTITVIKINFNEFVRKMRSDKTYSLFSILNQGRIK